MAVTSPNSSAEQFDIPGFIKQVKQMPVIWNTASSDHGVKHKMAAAWRQVCINSWPDFNTWSADDKRIRCLELQKRWKDLQQTFTRDYLKQKRAGNRDLRKSRNQYYDQLDFLVSTIRFQGKGDSEEEQKSAKKPRMETSADTDPDNEEDKHFLLSLVSFMREVPRNSKLALRAEMLQLITKYTKTDHPSLLQMDMTDSPQY